MISDYNIVAVVTAGSGLELQAFIGRPNRRTLIVAADAVRTTNVSTSGGDFDNNVFARIPAGQTLVMPLRDFGPLITGEIWVETLGGAGTINCAEVFDVPTRK